MRFEKDLAMGCGGEGLVENSLRQVTGACIICTKDIKSARYTERSLGPRCAVNGQDVVVADFIAIDRHGRSFAVEVKTKTAPGWRYGKRQYQHGFDYALISEYGGHGAISTFLVVVIENTTPKPWQRGHGAVRGARWGPWVAPGPKHSGALVLGENLIPGPVCLVAQLDALLQVGEHEKDWPRHGGTGSRNGAGGFLWPRKAMTQVYDGDDILQACKKEKQCGLF